MSPPFSKKSSSSRELSSFFFSWMYFILHCLCSNDANFFSFLWSISHYLWEKICCIWASWKTFKLIDNYARYWCFHWKTKGRKWADPGNKEHLDSTTVKLDAKTEGDLGPRMCVLHRLKSLMMILISVSSSMIIPCQWDDPFYMNFLSAMFSMNIDRLASHSYVLRCFFWWPQFTKELTRCL